MPAQADIKRRGAESGWGPLQRLLIYLQTGAQNSRKFRLVGRRPLRWHPGDGAIHGPSIVRVVLECWARDSLQLRRYDLAIIKIRMELPIFSWHNGEAGDGTPGVEVGYLERITKSDPRVAFPESAAASLAAAL